MSATQRAAAGLRGLLYAGALCSAACGRHHPAPSASAAPAALPSLAAATSDTPSSASGVAAIASQCLPTHDAYLRLRMRGDSNMDIDWHDAQLQCDGGPRPGQQGVRVTFAGPAQHDGHRLRFVFGIAVAPGARVAHNVPANVTVIFEGEHKLYSTAGDGKCTIDEFDEQPLAASPHLRRLSARGFCIAPATALAGKTALLVSRFDFAGPVLDEDVADAPPHANP